MQQFAPTVLAGGQCACACVCCQIQLICQCSGLFLERPELASLNQAAINLAQRWQGAVERRLMGGRAVVLLEQVTLQSGESFPDLHFSAERRKIMQPGDIYLSIRFRFNHQNSLNSVGCFRRLED